MATEEVAPTELPEGAVQTAEVIEQPTELTEGAGQAAEVVEQPNDDQTAVEPSENLPSEGTEVEAPKVE